MSQELRNEAWCMMEALLDFEDEGMYISEKNGNKIVTLSITSL